MYIKINNVEGLFLPYYKECVYEPETFKYLSICDAV